MIFIMQIMHFESTRPLAIILISSVFQAMLREFEDQENLLAEMDEQVDAYRAAGKVEAATRLEDQLHLIHERFQELAMKFELFQKQPTVEYEPVSFLIAISKWLYLHYSSSFSQRLARVARQLRDIKEKVILHNGTAESTAAMLSALLALSY